MTIMNSRNIFKKVFRIMQNTIIRKLLLVGMMIMVPAVLSAQDAFKGKYRNTDFNFVLTFDLTEEKIDVPGLEGLETCYGYFQGNLNGTWIILKVKKLDENKAVVRVACDRGNDAEDIELTVTESGLSFTQEEGCIKTIKDNKYVKLPKVIELKRF